MTRLRVPERPLVWAVRLGVLLLVLTPLVVAPRIVYPFAVGKAVWSRSVIEIVFALWAVLAVAHPAWRPPRSWLLVVLAAGLGVSVLSACFGVSVQRSLWSTYLRMQGVVDQTHWLAAAVVAASVFRRPPELRALLGFHLAVGLAVSLIAVAGAFALEVPLYGRLPEPRWPRIAATFGNPTFLGAYLLVNVVLALGLLARSLAPPPASRPGPGGSGLRKRRARRSSKPPAGSPGVWPNRIFHGLCVLCGLWALSLSGSMAALVGLIAAGGAWPSPCPTRCWRMRRGCAWSLGAWRACPWVSPLCWRSCCSPHRRSRRPSTIRCCGARRIPRPSGAPWAGASPRGRRASRASPSGRCSAGGRPTTWRRSAAMWIAQPRTCRPTTTPTTCSSRRRRRRGWRGSPRISPSGG